MEKSIIKVCCGNKCSERGSVRIFEEIENAFGDDSVEMVKCLNYCELAPNVEYDGKLYHEARTKTIVDRLRNQDGTIIKKLSIDDLKLDDDLLS
jgi:NADH:ubiquinone oxidoreductase subunit E